MTDHPPSTTPPVRRERDGERAGLWRHSGFLLLWGGQTVSQLGSQISIWALPLTAVYTLRAGAAQMGLLLAAGTTPLGAVVGGVLGTVIGLRATVVIAGCGTLFAFWWIFWSPVKRLRAQPTAPDEHAFAPHPNPETSSAT